MTDPALLPADAIEALRAGNKIEAIKRVRVATGVGLAEAKALVEAFERGTPAGKATTLPHHHAHAPPRSGTPGLSPGEVPRSDPWKAIALVLVIAVVALAVLLLRR